MPMERYKPEQIVTLPQQIEVEIATGNHATSLQGNRNHIADLQPQEERVRRVEAGSSQTTQGTGKGGQQAEAAGGGAVCGETGS